MSTETKRRVRKTKPGTARFSLRIPTRMLRQIEDLASKEGVSINTWLLLSAADSVSRHAASSQKKPTS